MVSPIPLVTFVTTCRGRLAHLRRSLPTFVAQPDAEVVVVDYDCPERSGEWVEQGFPQVKVVRASERPRFELSRARNLGAAAATAPWLCFIDADVCIASDFTARLRSILAPGCFYQAKPRTIETWGTSISARADFERVGGYDEVLQGWGKDDDDYYARLVLAGVRHSTFPGELLQPISHDDAQRVESYELKDRWLSESINHVYCRAKHDLELLRREPLALELRRRLYDEVRAAVLRARGTEGPLQIAIPFLQQETRACGSLQARLSYTLPRPQGDGVPRPNASSLIPRRRR